MGFRRLSKPKLEPHIAQKLYELEILSINYKYSLYISYIFELSEMDENINQRY